MPAATGGAQFVGRLSVLGQVDAGDLLVSGDPEADRLLEREAEGQRDQERVGQDRERPDRLLAQEVEARRRRTGPSTVP